MSDSSPVEAASDAKPASLKSMASRSVLWTAIGKASNTVISLGVTALLTRMPRPPTSAWWPWWW